MSSGKIDVRFWETEVWLGNIDLGITDISTVQGAVRVNEITLGKQERHKKKKPKDKDLVNTAKRQAEKRKPAKKTEKEQSDKAGRRAGLLLNFLMNNFLQLLCFTWCVSHHQLLSTGVFHTTK